MRGVCSGLLPVALLLSTLCSALPARAAGDPYVGIGSEVSDNPPGLRISVVPGAPGDLCGLRTGDVITAINGKAFSDTPDVPFQQQLTDALKGTQVGEAVAFTVYRDAPQLSLALGGQPYASDFPLQELPGLIAQATEGQSVALTAVKQAQTLEIKVTLGARPESLGPPFPPNGQLGCNVEDAHPGVRRFLDQLIDKRGIRADCDDLRTRLDKRASPQDGYKLSRVAYLLRDGLKSEAVARAISDTVAGEAGWGADGYFDTQYYIADLLDLRRPVAGRGNAPSGVSAEQHLDYIQQVLETAAGHVRAAFANFTGDERKFLAEQRGQLTEIFAKGNYVEQEDDNPQRIRGNLRLIELAKKIDYGELTLGQLTLAQLANAQYLVALREDLTRQFADRINDEDLLTRDTPLGKLIISGAGHSWRQGEAPALLIDLGGNDFYTTTAGSGTSLEHPAGVLIELGGDDAYESTTPYSQGSGSLGCGLLIDAAGDDEYIGLQWAQGCGFLGMGALLDFSGNDTYRGEELCQAASIFGSGVLIDYAGDDRYEGQMKCQSFAGAHAVALLIDVAGNDYRYAKGKYPTNYGDAGIFDSWSQGCAQGFRGYASGGIAALIDMAGADYNEAGNFSQGGGYYFGLGILHDRGWEGDRYIGSRYDQGFSAHQAVGVFLEDGGDDYYTTRQAVAQGLAWDECCTVFIDYAGNDTYEGGTGFSQGASAHNSLCVMWDRGGRDTYRYPSGQARAGGNDYHGGTSLSLFIEEGGEEDVYNCPQSSNGLVTGWKEHGFFADLPASLGSALKGDAWQALWVDTPESK
jgi:hypothetical protein